MEEGLHLLCLHRTLLSVHRTASSPLCGTTGLCFVLQTLWKQVQAQFVDQQEQQLLPPWSKQTGAWALSVPVFSSPIQFGIITPVVQGLIPAETWEPGTRGLRRSSVGREEGGTESVHPRTSAPREPLELRFRASRLQRRRTWTDSEQAPSSRSQKLTTNCQTSCFFLSFHAFKLPT